MTHVTCALCHRDVPAEMISRHHLTPKARGGKHDQRVPLCKPCHKQIHAIFSNRQLEEQYSDLRLLRAAPEMQPFVRWIRKQKPGRNFRTIASNARPRAKREKRRR